MSVSWWMVPPLKLEAWVKVTACGLLFWLIIVKIAWFVVLGGMTPWVLILICLLSLVYLAEYSGFGFGLLIRALVKPWSLVVSLLLAFAEAPADA